MINEAKYGLEYQLRTNDASREEERVRAAEYEISIPSDHNYDLESSDTSSEPASSSSKESTLPAKHTNDNEETPLKKNHPRPVYPNWFKKHAQSAVKHIASGACLGWSVLSLTVHPCLSQGFVAGGNSLRWYEKIKRVMITHPY